MKGRTLHQLRHSAIQHLAADGRTVPELQANPDPSTSRASAATSSSANRPPPRSPPTPAPPPAANLADPHRNGGWRHSAVAGGRHQPADLVPVEGALFPADGSGDELAVVVVGVAVAFLAALLTSLPREALHRPQSDERRSGDAGQEPRPQEQPLYQALACDSRTDLESRRCPCLKVLWPRAGAGAGRARPEPVRRDDARRPRRRNRWGDPAGFTVDEPLWREQP